MIKMRESFKVVILQTTDSAETEVYIHLYSVLLFTAAVKIIFYAEIQCKDNLTINMKYQHMPPR